MKKIKDWLIAFILCTWWLWALIITVAAAYLISASDLPAWFKFWLLK